MRCEVVYLWRPPPRRLLHKTAERVLGKRLYLRTRLRFIPEHSFLHHVHGVIHVGANVGQERDIYAAFDLPVIWIEPLPEIFETLAHNIREFPLQRALNSLVTAEDGKEYEFHVSNNRGESSSILNLSRSREMYPDVHYTSSIRLKSVTLPTLLTAHHVALGKYDALVMDVQGAELMVLAGASSILSNFRFIKLEAADFESYAGCCQLGEVTEFLRGKGFAELRRVPFDHTPGVGTFYNVTYRRQPLT